MSGDETLHAEDGTTVPVATEKLRRDPPHVVPTDPGLTYVPGVAVVTRSQPVRTSTRLKRGRSRRGVRSHDGDVWDETRHDPYESKRGQVNTGQV